MLLIHSTTADKTIALWVLNNIFLTSEKDSRVVLASGLVGNISAAMRGTVSTVREEALWAIAGLFESIPDETSILAIIK